jgi:hypothetical protein
MSRRASSSRNSDQMAADVEWAAHSLNKEEFVGDPRDHQRAPTCGRNVSDDPTGGDAADTRKSIETEFARMAEILDQSGLGPADYLYSALKAAQKIPSRKKVSLWRALRKNQNLRAALRQPPHIPSGLVPTPILVGTSYSVSKKLLGDVVAAFNPGEALLCDMRAAEPEGSSARWLLGLIRNVLTLGPGIVFALRARSALQKAGIESTFCNLIAVEALRHRIFRHAAKTILRRTHPSCIVIGNANRPFELALWAAAKASNIATVLIPYQEISLKSGRFLSLCRGAFDLVLTYSDYSAEQIRRLRPQSKVIVAGYPQRLQDSTVERESEPLRRPTALYLGGTVLEPSAAPIVRKAFEELSSIDLRVRTHPRMTAEIKSKLFDWIPSEQFSDAVDVDLSEDIRKSHAVITVRSTAALHAYSAGVPVVWLTPDAAMPSLRNNSFRRQGLVIAEVSTPLQLRSVLDRLAYDRDEWERLVAEQWTKLRRLGLVGDYFRTVTTAIRAEVRLNLLKGDL